MSATAILHETYPVNATDLQSGLSGERILSSIITENRKVIRSRKKFHTIIISGFALVFILGAILGALNAFASSIEVKTWKTESQIQLLDERIMEMRTTLYQDYNNLLRETPLSRAGTDGKGYFVRDTWEVGG